MLKKRYWIFGIWLSCFLIGSYTWKIFHTGSFFLGRKDSETQVDDMDFSVHVGDYLITRQEIEWEYAFYLHQLNAAPSSEGGQGLSSAPDKPIIELYNKIMADLIERKLLYQYIGSDSLFNKNEVSRFTHCLEQWKMALDNNAGQFANEQARGQLKSMLCEKDILDQYVKERIVKSIVLTDMELREYFKVHKNEFNQPARAIIRQVVLASEAEAKRVRSRINGNNFEEISREESISPEAAQGGRLGPFAKGDLPSVFDVAFEMNPGENQGILKSTYGFHIIMLEKKLPKAEQSFESARDQIQQILLKKRQDEEYKKWVEMALNTIPIKSSRAL
ncbi:MAG: peptidyl-prolyl cis-trans isomerase [Proteobacteria bacterium]|nr:peptidyl-prolyl cis-trans isomerase [Pseudomonadota bacterium]